MSLQKTGVILTAENEAGFLRAMNSSRAAVKGFEGAAEGAQNPIKGVGLAGLTMASIVGGVVVNALSAAVSGFANLARSAVGAVAANERLSATFESMIAKELRNRDATLEMGAALDMASPRARELLGWLEQLVIQSPFEREGIVMALQTAVAYGFVTQGAKDLADAQAKGIVTAQRLTEALVNWAAGMGKSSFEVQRVTLALGQMQARGKVTGEELRQLMEAGADAQGPLKALGYTVDDVSKGLVSADEYIKQFVETLENDMGDAAKRQAGTLTGLMSSLGDLSQTYLREFFGPINEATGKVGGVIGAVMPVLQRFVDLLTNPKIIKGVHDLGLMLGDVLSGGLEKAAGLAGYFVETFSKPIIDTAQKAFAWGENIAMQLANGLIQGAANALIGAINFIAGMLSNWFAPGSPPKVAPDIDLWGAEAMDEWLHGFSMADFGVLKGLQSPIRGALQALAGAGKISDKNASKIYVELSNQIAKTMAEGGDMEALFNKIKKKTKGFGVELAELARRQFAVADATKAVENAEKALEAARKKAQDAGLAISQLTQEYNDMLRRGASQEELDAQLAKINAQEQALDNAQEEGAAAEDAYQAARDNLAVLQEQLKLQQELVQTLIDLANAQNAANATDPAGGGGGGGGPTPPEPPDTGGIEEAFNEMLDRIKQSIVDKLREAFQPLVDSFNNAIAKIWEAWTNLLGLFQSSGLAETLENIWGNMLTLTQIFIDLLYEWITTGLATLIDIWNTHKDQVGQIWEKMWNLIADIAGNVLGLIVQNIDQRLQEAADFFTARKEQLSNIIQLTWDNIQTIINFALTNILDFIEARLDSLQKIWDKYGKASLKAIDRIWDKIAEIFWFTLGELIDTVEFALQAVQEFWAAHGEAIQIIVTFFMDKIGRIVDGTLAIIALIITGVLEFMAAMWEMHGDSIMAIIGAAFEFIRTIIGAVLDVVGGIVEVFAGLITGDFERIKEGVTLIWQGMWDAVTGALTFAATVITAIFTIIKQTVTTLIALAVDFVKEKWREMVENIQEKIEAARAFIQEKVEAIQTKLSETWEAIQTKAEEIWQAVKDYIEEKLAALFEKMGLDLDEMKERWSNIWEDVKDIASEIWDRIYEKITGKIAEVKEWVQTRLDEIKSKWDEIWEGVSTKLTEIWDEITGNVDEKTTELKTGIETKITLLKKWWEETWGLIRGKLVEIWTGLVDKISEKVQEIYDNITGKVDEILDQINGAANDFYSAGADLINGFIDGIVKTSGRIIEVITQAVEKAIQAAKDALDMNSPSKVFAEIGQNTMIGMEQGVQKTADKPKKEVGKAALGLTHTMQALISPPAVSQLQTANTYNQSMDVTVNNNVNSNIDLAALSTFIVQTINQQFERR